MFLYNDGGRSLIGDIFIVHDKISNKETFCTHEASDNHFN
jgi:hypothetical protein